MARSSFIAILFLLLPTVSCGTMRTIEICKITIDQHTTMDSPQPCAKGDKKYTKKLRDLTGGYTLQEKGLRKIGDKLEECERLAEECKD